MTDKKSRRVVIIDNINSDSIDQAIFILKSDPSSAPMAVNSGVAKEAQDIINNYIRHVEHLKDGCNTPTGAIAHKKRRPQILISILGLLGAVCIALTITVFRFIS